MAAIDTLRQHANEAGWTEPTQIIVLCNFIDELGDHGLQTLDQFLREQREEEDAMSAEASTDDEFIQFEYDTTFFGGDYDDVGDFALVPLSLCHSLGFEQAFRRHTGIDPQHIIHYSEDEIYNSEGDVVGEDLEDIKDDIRGSNG